MIRTAALAVSSLAIAGMLALSPGRAEAQNTITCESRGHDRAYCSADTRGGVRLVRQLSESRCVSGRTWGTDGRGIWVSDGCRAQFAIGSSYGDRDRRDRDDRYDRDGRYDNRGRGHEQRAERVCRGAVGERFRNIRRGDVETDYRGADRAGNHVVRWRTNRAAGSCIISTSGRVLDLRVNRR
jgi:hypothetical protein